MLVGVLDGLMMNSYAVEMLLMKFTVLIRDYQVSKDFVFRAIHVGFYFHKIRSIL